MCPVLNLQCQLTTTYFNLEFLSDVFFQIIILIPLIYGFCCVFCYNRYFALGKSSDMFVYTENIYTRNLFTKSSRIFCFSWWSHAPSVTYMYSPWLCTSQLVWCKWQDRLSKKKIRSAGFYISRIFNTQPLSRRDLLEGFYTCTKLSRVFFYFTTKRWCT